MKMRLSVTHDFDASSCEVPVEMSFLGPFGLAPQSSKAESAHQNCH